MRFSANIGFLYDGVPLVERIHAAKHHGFDAVECHFPYDVDPSLVSEALEATGLPMLGLNTHPGDSFGLLAIPGQETKAREAIDEAVRYAAAIKAGNVHVMAGKSGGGEAAETCYRENLRYACDVAGAQGLTVLIEPINQRDVPGYHLSRVEHASDIIGSLGLDNLRMMFDCYHTQIMQGDLMTRAETYLPIIGHIQIAAVPDRGEPDGGELHYANLLRAFGEMGWRAPVGAEYKPRSGSVDAGIGWLSSMRQELK